MKTDLVKTRNRKRAGELASKSVGGRLKFVDVAMSFMSGKDFGFYWV